MKNNRGSALLVAILLSAILLAALAALLTVSLNEYRGSIKSYLSTAAFSLAEAGVDRAAASIGSATPFAGAQEVASWPNASTATPGWYKKSGTTTFRGYFPVEDLDKGRRGTCSVICTPNGTNQYDVYALGVATGGPNGSLVAERALHVGLKKSAQSSAGSGYALAALNGISLATASTPVFKKGDNTGFPRIASYDSSLGAPNLWTDITSATSLGTLKGSNVSDDVMIAVKGGELNLQNALVYGKVGVAAGASVTSNTYSDLRKEIYGQTSDSTLDNTRISMKTAVLVDLDVATTSGAAAMGVYRGYNLDAIGAEMAAYDQAATYSTTDLAKVSQSGVLTNYTFDQGTFDVPVLSEMEGYGTGTARTTTADSSAASITQNTSTLTLDASKATYYTNSDGQALGSVTTINVSGTVLLYAPKGFQAQNGLTINYATSDSKLTIFSDGSVGVKMATCPTYTATDGTKKEIAPKQFQIAVANGSAVELKADKGVFAGLVRAPKSDIKISTSGSGNGRNSADIATQMAGRLQLRGQFIANKIDMSGSNNVDILYDVRTKGTSTTKTMITVSSWKQILPSLFAAQLN